MTERTPAKRRPRAERRAQLLDVATQAFYERGYEASSLQEIADRMGVLKGSLYYYFSSKEDLLFEVVSTIYDRAAAVVTAAAAVPAPPLEKLANVVSAHVEDNCNNIVQTAVFLHEFDMLPRERRREIIGDRTAFHGIIRDILIDAQAQGEANPDLDPDLAVLAILGSANWVYRWFKPKGGQSTMDVARQFAAMAVASVATVEYAAAHEPTPLDATRS